MIKTFKTEDLDCAACAEKIQEAVGKIAGVNSCSVSYMTLKMTMDIQDGKEDEVIKETKKVVKKVEPDVTLVEL